MHLLTVFLTMIKIINFLIEIQYNFLLIPLLFVYFILACAHECGKKRLKLKFKQGLLKIIYVIK